MEPGLLQPQGRPKGFQATLAQVTPFFPFPAGSHADSSQQGRSQDWKEPCLNNGIQTRKSER